MFLLNFIPDILLTFFVNAILILGVVGTIASSMFRLVIQYVPTLIPYRTVLQVVSVLLLAIGIYFKGGIAVEQKWRDRVKELEEKVAAAEAESKTVNEKIVTVYKDKVKVVKDTEVVIQEKIVEKTKVIDAECKVAQDAIDIINQAAKNPEVKK